jgi:hypothetical protein
MRLLFAVLLAALLGSGTLGAELNWPQFRGPRGDGTSAATNVPARWGETNNIVSKISLPGRGRSSPVTLDDRIWLTTAIERGVQRIQIAADDMRKPPSTSRWKHSASTAQTASFFGAHNCSR